MSDANENFDTGTTGSYQEFIALEHKGGDRVDASQLRVAVRNNESTVLGTWEQGSWDVQSGEVNRLNLTHNGNVKSFGSNYYDDTEIQTGDRIVVRIDISAFGTDVVDDADYTVKVLDTKSERIIAESTVRAR